MKGKTVLITGGSSGIGKALAFAFGNAGANIVITGRHELPLQTVAQELSEAGITALPLVADVSVREDNRVVVERTIERFGQLDVLINNAGISMRSLFSEADPDVLRKVMDINFFGMVYATHYALPYLKATGGSIVGISSIAGYRGLPVRTGYSASKAAMNGFLEALRTELLYEGVNVLTASPGFTASNIRVASLGKDGQAMGDSMRDEGSMMSAEEVAQHILKATIQRKRTLLLTAQGKFTVFLNKWAPGLMDKLTYSTLAKEKDSPLRKK